tara:strand:+ start:1326 stop:1499 length:174 start_codon:yes stop_codon:yes gene_type:complete
MIIATILYIVFNVAVIAAIVYTVGMIKKDNIKIAELEKQHDIVFRRLLKYETQKNTI